VENLREASRTSVRMRGNLIEFPQPGSRAAGDEDDEDIADAA